ncbi:DUF3105 domain-containing protein [Chondromyces crocatus]|uniref:DUF3105 domain-containing protein n=1 Tax=Chondromyces crocatus TaxID=52 RepID=A0A0K1EJ58_CHOCO|nr:DUF3105 domain-containing protein [Chondromyces crocatus]AKT40702.1 uncharacterized protein CMC5_048580 [Chondromyces crocatus]
MMAVLGDWRHAGASIRGVVRLLAFGVGLSLAGCGDDADPTPNGTTSTVPEGAEIETLSPGAQPLPGESECKVVIARKIPVESANHLDECSSLEFAANPPSSGDHWPRWAAFRRYTVPVAREMYVHNQEHGGVVLSYRCSGACPSVVAMLEQVMDDYPDDVFCSMNIPVVRNRLLLTPDPKLPTTIAASAWGATYTATCLDPTSLAAFVAEVYGKGPELTCFDGVDVAESGGTLPECAD